MWTIFICSSKHACMCIIISLEGEGSEWSQIDSGLKNQSCEKGALLPAQSSWAHTNI